VISVFFGFISEDAQAYAIFLVLVVSLIIQKINMPYQEDHINKLELFSLAISLMLTYFGMFFLSGMFYSTLNI